MELLPEHIVLRLLLRRKSLRLKMRRRDLQIDFLRGVLFSRKLRKKLRRQLRKRRLVRNKLLLIRLLPFYVSLPGDSFPQPGRNIVCPYPCVLSPDLLPDAATAIITPINKTAKMISPAVSFPKPHELYPRLSN